MNIILFGPPGVGKSTLIGYLKLDNVKAIDLEDVYPSSIRFQLPSMVDGVVFGGADLNPARHYNNAIKVLLYLEQDIYDKRREMRDSIQLAKSHQKHHVMDDWLKQPAHYDYILDMNFNPKGKKPDALEFILAHLPYPTKEAARLALLGETNE